METEKIYENIKKEKKIIIKTTSGLKFTHIS